jgi:hypothetical protein
MTTWPRDPVLHEIFTWVWLEELGRALGRQVTLADVPADVWDDVARPGFDAVWLMGVWERSATGVSIARADGPQMAGYRDVLADFADRDLVGSAYSVRSYRVDPHLGGDRGLAVARAELAARGVRLVLDLVPNHVAPDHPWTVEHPEYFVRGSAADLARDPAAFVRVGEHVYACGRDPYFPAWSDVVQLDAARPEVRAAMADLVVRLADHCDGLRCDMAMLLLDEVFTRTWGALASTPADDRGFWPSVIGAVRRVRPDFRMWAEAYWDLEPALVQQGFDACYDKRLYDRIVHRAPIEEIRAHLAAPIDGQHRTVRFVENHDEPRVASLLNSDEHLAALVTILTVPGVALVHEGELDQRRIRVPVQLGRRPAETTDVEFHVRASRLLDAVAEGMRTGDWALAEVTGWPDNHSADRLLAWSWTGATQRHLVVVNLTGAPADGMVVWPWSSDAGRSSAELQLGGGRPLVLVDLLSGERYERDPTAVLADGLYVSLPGHGVHVLRATDS